MFEFTVGELEHSPQFVIARSVTGAKNVSLSSRCHLKETSAEAILLHQSTDASFPATFIKTTPRRTKPQGDCFVDAAKISQVDFEYTLNGNSQ
jgi:hypothetical protein